MSECLMGASSGKSAFPKSKSNLSSQDVSSSSEDETDSSAPSPSKKGSQKRKAKDKHKMPLFRKQSDKAKKRSDHQKWLVCMVLLWS